MIISLRFCRRSLLICSALFVAVALVLAAGVIPPVKADTFSSATPERALPAFWVVVVIQLVVAAVVGVIAIRTTGRSRLSLIVLGLVAFLVLLLAFGFTDGASAYSSHGPAMQTSSTLLFFCSAADLLAGVLVIITALLLPKQT